MVKPGEGVGDAVGESGRVRAAVRERRGVETGKDKNGDSDPREPPEREKVMRGQHLMPRM
jgi:hypothetical protein